MCKSTQSPSIMHMDFKYRKNYPCTPSGEESFRFTCNSLWSIFRSFIVCKRGNHVAGKPRERQRTLRALPRHPTHSMFSIPQFWSSKEMQALVALAVANSAELSALKAASRALKDQVHLATLRANAAEKLLHQREINHLRAQPHVDVASQAITPPGIETHLFHRERISTLHKQLATAVEENRRLTQQCARYEAELRTALADAVAWRRRATKADARISLHESTGRSTPKKVLRNVYPILLGLFTFSVVQALPGVESHCTPFKLNVIFPNIFPCSTSLVERCASSISNVEEYLIYCLRSFVGRAVPAAAIATLPLCLIFPPPFGASSRSRDTHTIPVKRKKYLHETIRSPEREQAIAKYRMLRSLEQYSFKASKRRPSRFDAFKFFRFDRRCAIGFALGLRSFTSAALRALNGAISGIFRFPSIAAEKMIASKLENTELHSGPYLERTLGVSPAAFRAAKSRTLQALESQITKSSGEFVSSAFARDAIGSPSAVVFSKLEKQKDSALIGRVIFLARHLVLRRMPLFSRDRLGQSTKRCY